MTEAEIRKEIVDTLMAYKGAKEGSKKHRELVDVYNSHTPRARGYALKYTDDWCAGTVCAAAVMCGHTDLFPMEVSVPKMVELAKGMEIWVEDDGYTPAPGDLIVFYWKDSGSGDATGGANHIGMVAEVKDGKITTIEGNMSDAVGSRTIAVNGKYIRGFICPDYGCKASVRKTDAARSGPDKEKAGTYTIVGVKSWLNLRTGASTGKDLIEHMPKGSKVTCYGYYTGSWLYVRSAAGNVGFCHSKYLAKE